MKYTIPNAIRHDKQQLNHHRPHNVYNKGSLPVPQFRFTDCGLISSDHDSCCYRKRTKAAFISEAIPLAKNPMKRLLAGSVKIEALSCNDVHRCHRRIRKNDA